MLGVLAAGSSCCRKLWRFMFCNVLRQSKQRAPGIAINSNFRTAHRPLAAVPGSTLLLPPVSLVMLPSVTTCPPRLQVGLGGGAHHLCLRVA